jgi:hypothetical protein
VRGETRMELENHLINLINLSCNSGRRIFNPNTNAINVGIDKEEITHTHTNIFICHRNDDRRNDN